MENITGKVIAMTLLGLFVLFVLKFAFPVLNALLKFFGAHVSKVLP